MTTQTETNKLKKSLHTVLKSFSTLFQIPVNGILEIRKFDHREPFIMYKQVLLAIEKELNCISKSQKEAIKSSDPDSIDYFNALISEYEPQTLSEILTTGVLDIMTAGRLFLIEDNVDIHEDEILHYQLNHAEILVKDGIEVVKNYFNSIKISKKLGPARLRPSADRFLKAGMLINDTKQSKKSLAEQLRSRALKVDPFRTSRVFRFINQEFVSSDLVSIRPVADFFGYKEIRDLFYKYFTDFSVKGENFPLLISSLPGLGKTHFTISYTLFFDDLTLILPEPGDLERPLETIISQLARRKNRKFVIFFDDVDTRKIDWYNFRTLVGGSFVLPDNISIVIASNYEFPANISSRGRGLTFPIFDEIACMEMVGDFLRQMGMHNPPESLIAVIATDYVEEFGQNAFEELSPRTLVRYLEQYDNNSAKRAKMLTMSREQMIAQPDSQVFYEANLSITERLNISV